MEGNNKGEKDGIWLGISFGAIVGISWDDVGISDGSKLALPDGCLEGNDVGSFVDCIVVGTPLPLIAGPSLKAVKGASETDGVDVGSTQCVTFGLSEGNAEETLDGESDENLVGTPVGTSVAKLDGDSDGVSDGDNEGEKDGIWLGISLGVMLE